MIMRIIINYRRAAAYIDNRNHSQYARGSRHYPPTPPHTTSPSRFHLGAEKLDFFGRAPGSVARKFQLGTVLGCKKISSWVRDGD